MAFNTVLAYKINDLIMVAKLEEICRGTTPGFVTISSKDELAKFSINSDSVMVILDLIASRNELETVREIAQERGWKTFGFYPHVDREIASLVKSLQIDYVIPRSALQAKLKSLLT